MKIKVCCLYTITLLFVFVLALSSCNYVNLLTYIEGAKIDRTDYTIEYTSIKYDEEKVIVNLKMTKKNDNEVSLDSAKAYSFGGNYYTNPNEVYFNGKLMTYGGKLTIESSLTEIELIYPIEVRNGSFDLVISKEIYNMRLKTKEELFGTSASIFTIETFIA